MKKLLIVKTGSTYPWIRRQAGDFEDMVRDGCEISNARTLTCEVYRRPVLPEIQEIGAVIITGSHAMVTEKPEWSRYLAKWLREKAFGQVPVLGICFGHQLLAQCSGGRVDFHPRGTELGTTRVRLTVEGKTDPLLKVLPPEFPAHVAHSQTVRELPPGARLLAENTFEAHHSFSLKGNIWGLQFHPEFTAEVMRLYISLREKKATQDRKTIFYPVIENPYGKILLQRFREIAEGV